jgi:hypothetical protein
VAKRLKTPGDVRRYLAALMNDLAAGRIDPAVAGRLGYLGNILVRTMEVSFQQSKISVLQERLDELEARLGD